jgi:hypothetical protein
VLIARDLTALSALRALTILKTKLSRSIFASRLGPVKWSMIPFTIHDALLSPGAHRVIARTAAHTSSRNASAGAITHQGGRAQ